MKTTTATKPATDCNNSTWTTRVRWTDAERLAIGMALDRLKCDEATRLIPDVELIKCYAQAEALPLERRRKLNDIQAAALLQWIDSKRDEQEASLWLDPSNAASLPVASIPDSPPDELEVLTEDVNRLAARVGNLEGSILNKIQSMLDAHYHRIEQLIGSPAQSTVPAKTPIPKYLLVYPDKASWGDEVLKVSKKISKEGHKICVAPVSDSYPVTGFDPLDYDKIITIDSAAVGLDGAKARTVVERVMKQTHNEGLVDVVNIRCATHSQILTRVKSEIQKT